MREEFNVEKCGDFDAVVSTGCTGGLVNDTWHKMGLLHKMVKYFKPGERVDMIGIYKPDKNGDRSDDCLAVGWLRRNIYEDLGYDDTPISEYLAEAFRANGFIKRTAVYETMLTSSESDKQVPVKILVQYE